MYIAFLFLFLSAATAAEPPADQSRQNSLYNFMNLITCFQPSKSIGLYLDYGCYCGKGGTGKPLDETDMCCYVHDNCYGQVENDHDLGFFQSTYMSGFYWSCADRVGYCEVEQNNDFQQALCECDRVAAECFYRHRLTLSTTLYNIDTDLCCKVSNADCNVQDAPHILGRLYDCDRTGDQNRCCNKKGYNSDIERCCGSTVALLSETPKGLSCCYNTLYDASKDLCCYGTVHRGVDHIKCCGREGGAIDVRSQKCEDGKIVFK